MPPLVVLNEHGPAKASAGAKPRDIAASLSRYGRWLATTYRHAKEAHLFATQEVPLAWRIAQVIRAEQPDLLHSNNTVRGSRITGVAARMARVRVPVGQLVETVELVRSHLPIP